MASAAKGARIRCLLEILEVRPRGAVQVPVPDGSSGDPGEQRTRDTASILSKTNGNTGGLGKQCADKSKLVIRAPESHLFVTSSAVLRATLLTTAPGPADCACRWLQTACASASICSSRCLRPRSMVWRRGPCSDIPETWESTECVSSRWLLFLALAPLRICPTCQF